MSKSPRKQRIAQGIRDILSEMIDRELKDPRIAAAGFVGVNHVELNRDGSVARVYVSFYGGPEVEVGGEVATAAIAGLEAASGFLRGHIGRRLSLKRAPELRFIHDDSPDLAVRLSEIVRADEARAEPGDGDD